MTDSSWPDQTIHDTAVTKIRRKSINVEQWSWTSIAILRPELESLLHLHEQELPLASAFISTQSWYAFTTRRIITCHAGTVREIDPRYGIESNFGNFKGLTGSDGLGSMPVETCAVRSLRADESVEYEFETGNASMVPMYACMFWESIERFHFLRDSLLQVRGGSGP